MQILAQLQAAGRLSAAEIVSCPGKHTQIVTGL